MEIPIDYHILFMVMSFLLFLMSILLLFIDNTFEKTIAAMVFIFLNIVICGVNTLGFFGYDLYGFDASGAVVHNPISSAYFLGILYFALIWINVMLLFYCFYMFWKNAKEKVRTEPDAEEKFYSY